MATRALTVIEEKKQRKPNRKDRVFWSLFHQKISVEEIAARHNVKPETVINSLARMETYRALNSGDEVALALNEMVLRRIKDFDQAMARGLRAKKDVRERDPETGNWYKVGTEQDTPSQLAAAELLRKVADRNLPKGGGVQVNVQQNNAGATADTGARGRGFEAVLRKAREDAGMTNVDEVIEAEIIGEVDESAEDDEEDSEEDGEPEEE